MTLPRSARKAATRRPERPLSQRRRDRQVSNESLRESLLPTPWRFCAFARVIPCGGHESAQSNRWARCAVPLAIALRRSDEWSDDRGRCACRRLSDRGSRALDGAADRRADERSAAHPRVPRRPTRVENRTRWISRASARSTSRASISRPLNNPFPADARFLAALCVRFRRAHAPRRGWRARAQACSDIRAARSGRSCDLRCGLTLVLQRAPPGA